VREVQFKRRRVQLQVQCRIEYCLIGAGWCVKNSQSGPCNESRLPTPHASLALQNAAGLYYMTLHLGCGLGCGASTT
jgi:hypothetical protein